MLGWHQTPPHFLSDQRIHSLRYQLLYMSDIPMSSELKMFVASCI